MSQRYSFLEQFDRFMQKTKPVTCFFYRAYKFPNVRRMHSSKHTKGILQCGQIKVKFK